MPSRADTPPDAADAAADAIRYGANISIADTLDATMRRHATMFSLRACHIAADAAMFAYAIR